MSSLTPVASTSTTSAPFGTPAGHVQLAVQAQVALAQLERDLQRLNRALAPSSSRGSTRSGRRNIRWPRVRRATGGYPASVRRRPSESPAARRLSNSLTLRSRGVAVPGRRNFMTSASCEVCAGPRRHARAFRPRNRRPRLCLWPAPAKRAAKRPELSIGFWTSSWGSRPGLRSIWWLSRTASPAGWRTVAGRRAAHAARQRHATHHSAGAARESHLLRAGGSRRNACRCAGHPARARGAGAGGA